MRKRRPPVASLDAVWITRDGDEAIIEYADGRFWTTHFKLGTAGQHMTDQAVRDAADRGAGVGGEVRAIPAYLERGLGPSSGLTSASSADYARAVGPGTPGACKTDKGVDDVV